MRPDDVKAARLRLGLTQSQLAERLRLKPPYGADVVRSWEKGRRPISGPAQVAIELMERVDRIQSALVERVRIYSKKAGAASPFAEDDSNRHERFSFVVECLEYFAGEAGLDLPNSTADSANAAPCIGDSRS